jgi:uncharacterized membrane protein
VSLTIVASYATLVGTRMPGHHADVGVLTRFLWSILGTFVVLIVFLAGAIGGAALFVGLGSTAFSHHWVDARGKEALEGLGDVACALGAAMAVRLAIYTVPGRIYRRRLPRLRASRQRVLARVNKVVSLHGMTKPALQDGEWELVRCRLYFAWQDPDQLGVVRSGWRTYRFRTKEETAEFLREYPEGKDIWILLKQGKPGMTIPDIPYPRAGVRCGDELLRTGCHDHRPRRRPGRDRARCRWPCRCGG